MAIEIRKAERTKSKLRLGLAGPAGSGKTMSALKLAFGIGAKVCLIDTERGSGDLYANLGDYSVITLEPPFKPDVFVDAIHAAEKAGFDVIIVDSLSHAWSDEGGILDQADKMQASGKNRFTMWADLTPQHRKLVNALLNSPKHIICTMRSKQEYAMEEVTSANGNRKTEVRKLGMAPIQRDGMEYEFTIFFDIDQNHYAKASKDRTDMFKNEVQILDEKTGDRLLKWLNAGKDDVNGLKYEIMGQFERLEIPVPTDKATLKEFLSTAIKKLTGIDLIDENLTQIVNALIAIEDRKAAYQTVFEGQALNPDNAIEYYRLQLQNVKSASELIDLWTLLPVNAKAQLALIYEDVKRKFPAPKVEERNAA